MDTKHINNSNKEELMDAISSVANDSIERSKVEVNKLIKDMSLCQEHNLKYYFRYEL